MRAAAEIAPVLASSGATLVALSAEGSILIYEGLPAATLKATIRTADPVDRVAISGDTILAASSTASAGNGGVSVYTRQADKWTETSTIKPLKSMDTKFGSALAIQGTTSVVGAQTSEASSGIQIAFQPLTRTDSAQSVYLTIENSSVLGGLAVDGDYVLVGIPGVGVQVVLRNAEAWDRQVLLVPEDDVIPKSFGSVIAFAGRTVIIGAPDENKFYIFTRGDTAWAQRHVFSDAKNPGFGQAVAIYETDVLVAGSQGATLYIREGSPEWKPGITFKAQGADFGKAATITKGVAAVSSADGVIIYAGKGAAWKQTGVLK